jgi:hypothetical protein
MSEPTTVSADGVTLQVPEGWEQVEAPGATLAVAGPVGIAVAEGTGFRPSLTAIVVEASPDADIRLLGTEAVAAARVVADDVHVLAYDVWPLPDGSRGRRLEFTFQHGEVPLCVRQWIALRDGRVVTLTGTTDVAHLLQHGPQLEDLATAALATQETR